MNIRGQGRRNRGIRVREGRTTARRQTVRGRWVCGRSCAQGQQIPCATMDYECESTNDNVNTNLHPYLEKPGPTWCISQNLSPSEIFNKVFPGTLLCNIAQETNWYYS